MWGLRLVGVAAMAAGVAAAVLVSPGRSGVGEASIVLHPGSTRAQAVPLPVEAGPDVQVIVSGLLTQKANGKTVCWDAFYYNDCSSNWKGNGVVNSIWLVPPGWNGSISSVVLPTSLLVPAGSPYPEFGFDHRYHLSLNLTGKQGWSFFAAATVRGGTLADWSGSFTLDLSGPSTGGPPPSTAPTATAPFGTPVSIRYRLGAVVGVPSPPLPAQTAEVDLNAEISDAEITQFVAALKLALAAYNRRKALEALSYWCLIFVPNSDGQALGLNYFAATPDACDTFAASLLKKGKGGKRVLSTAAGRCAVAYMPVWKAGTHVTVQMRNAALAAARTEVQASCTGTRPGRLTLKIVARANTTLNQVLGKSVRAGVGAAGKSQATPQLTLTWAPPHTRGAPPPPTAKAKPGHYTGQTSDNNPDSFDVSADSTNVTNIKAAGHVTCTDNSGWTWTITSTSTNPISSRLTFSRAYSGGLTINGASISNINITYTLTGGLTGSGTATGNLQINHISWDQNGTHYDCTGTQASWTAQLSG